MSGSMGWCADSVPRPIVLSTSASKTSSTRNYLGYYPFYTQHVDCIVGQDASKEANRPAVHKKEASKLLCRDGLHSSGGTVPSRLGNSFDSITVERYELEPSYLEGPW